MPRRPEGPRAVALAALLRCERDDAYANIALDSALRGSALDDRDRRLVTDLVYGTTRMRRACDAALAPFLRREPDAETRCTLRLGAYQLLYQRVPPHAAVSETVALIDRRRSGFVNAVLRRVADAGSPTWRSPAEELSYPDWIVDRLSTDLGDEAIAALTAMNEPGGVTERADGYVQDPASSWVAEAVRAGPGDRVADLCAAPGGKASLLAGAGATVFALDRRPGRVRSMARRLGRPGSPGAGTSALTSVLIADGAASPLAPASMDRVLVDAPCSGLGSLRRRADLRWRIQPDAIDRLVSEQLALIEAGLELLARGGILTYSVCTVTEAETVGIERSLRARRPDLECESPTDPRWRRHGRGGLILPHDHGTDGMFVLQVRRR